MERSLLDRLDMKTLRKEWFVANGAIVGAIGVMGALVACASTPGARPHDMSVEGHEGMAAREEAAAEAHEARFDPSADEERTRCRETGGRTGGPICWSSLVNPTKEHLRDAEDHRRRAADHRAAAQSLQDAEARACAGIAEGDRDMSPFNHREDIVRVDPLTAPGSDRWSPAVVQGATVVFRAVPGLIAEWLQRTIDCHIARNASAGHDASDMPYCPLMLKGVRASVTSTDAGFAVAVTSQDRATAAEIQRRAQALVGH